jgi:cytochrome c553
MCHPEKAHQQRVCDLSRRKLQGVGLIAPLAGRSSTCIIRQLVAFKTGARMGANGQPMLAVVAKLKIGKMIDLAAYAASLPPWQETSKSLQIQ